jgi:Ca2+-binding RTX toxin-like protein
VGDVGVDFLGDGTVTVSGLLEGYQTLLSTADGFNRIEVESVDGKFDLGGIVVSTAGAGDPIDMDFALIVSDEDGDTAAGTLAVTTVPDGGSVIVGTGADETLIGGTTDDTLTGNGGSDNLTGGAGIDTFIYAAGDGGATVALADLISDFEDGTDLIGLTGGLTFGDLTIDQSSDVVGDGTNDTVISVTAGGEILAVLDGITTTLDGSDIAIV